MSYSTRCVEFDHIYPHLHSILKVHERNETCMHIQSTKGQDKQCCLYVHPSSILYDLLHYRVRAHPTMKNFRSIFPFDYQCLSQQHWTGIKAKSATALRVALSARRRSGGRAAGRRSLTFNEVEG